MTRHKLPNRRLLLSQTIVWPEREGRTWLVSIGFDRSGRVAEAFVDGFKTGSDVEAWADRSLMLLSRCLQHGDSAAELLVWLKGAGEPDLITGILERAVELETREGEAIRTAYLCAEGKHPLQLAGAGGGGG